MASFFIHNSRPVFGTGRYPSWMGRNDHLDDVRFMPLPPKEQLLTPTVVHDAKTGLAYPILDNMPDDQWVAADVVMRWYSASFEMVVKWVREGLIAVGATRKGVKRYRILDPHRLMRDKISRAAKANRRAR